MKITAEVMYDGDERYPLIVISGDVRLGISLAGGEIRPVCLCGAQDESECCCDYSQFTRGEYGSDN